MLQRLCKYTQVFTTHVLIATINIAHNEQECTYKSAFSRKLHDFILSVRKFASICNTLKFLSQNLYVTTSERAERIMEGKGTLNELKVCSNEIAASTAQLVVSSQVKADKESKKLAGELLAEKH